MNNLGIIIQARSGSKRFPNKIYKKICEITIIEHVLKQIKKTKFKNKIIIASSINQTNKKIIQIAKKNNYNADTAENFEDALKKITSKERKIICVFGSLYLCGNILNKN